VTTTTEATSAPTLHPTEALDVALGSFSRP